MRKKLTCALCGSSRSWCQIDPVRQLSFQDTEPIVLEHGADAKVRAVGTVVAPHLHGNACRALCAPARSEQCRFPRMQSLIHSIQLEVCYKLFSKYNSKGNCVRVVYTMQKWWTASVRSKSTPSTTSSAAAMAARFKAPRWCVRASRGTRHWMNVSSSSCGTRD
jgi:hypothetical protein